MIGFKKTITSLYCTFVLNRNISSWTRWSTWNFLFNNVRNKYKCSFEWTLDNALYVKPYFVTPVRSNVK